MRLVDRAMVGLLVTLATAGCAMELDAEDAELDEMEIVNGGGDNPQTSAVGMLVFPSGTCSASMIANDLALTACQGGAQNLGEVDISGVRKGVRVYRDVGHVDLFALQLRAPLPIGGSTSGYARGIDRAPLTGGEIVLCHGYSGGRLRQGQFEVADVSGGYLHLRGRPNPNLVDYEVSREDRGGFCERDGSIAAILVRETMSGVALAVPAHDLDPALDNVRYVASVSRRRGAVKLRDDLAQRFITADMGGLTVGARAQLQATDDRRQSFYLDKLGNPPGGGTEWYRLVGAWDGRCLVSTGTSLLRETCNGQRREQVFYLQVERPNGLDRYRLRAVGGSVDADPSGGTAPGFIAVAPSSAASSQLWEMWLSPY